MLRVTQNLRTFSLPIGTKISVRMSEMQGDWHLMKIDTKKGGKQGTFGV